MSEIVVTGTKHGNDFEVTLRGEVHAVVNALVNGLTTDSLGEIVAALDKELARQQEETESGRPVGA